MVTFLLLLGSLITAQVYAQELPPLIPRTVLFGNPEKTKPHISPDGKYLSYLAPVNGVLNIWVKTIGTDNDHHVTSETKRGIWSYFWQNNTLLYQQDTNGDENWHIYKIDQSTQSATDLTPFDGVRACLCSCSCNNLSDHILITMNKENKERFDLYKLTISTGHIELIEKNPGNISGWVSDHQQQARAAKSSIQPDGGSSLLLRATETDPWKTITTWGPDDAGQVQIFGFSPDGSRLYWMDASLSNTTRLLEYNCSTGQCIVLAQDPDYDLGGIITDRTGKLLATVIARTRVDIVPLDQEFAVTLQAMHAIDKEADLYIEDISMDNRLWVIAFCHDNHSTKMYLFDTVTQSAQFLFTVLPALDRYPLASMKPISFTTRDGLSIHGYLTCPEHLPQEKLPLILLIHGGPWQRNSWYCDTAVQWLVNRGYACLQINFRGSLGYGKKFLNAGNREWGGTMQNDLVDAIQWAIDQGIADPYRIAMYGASYGGYAALMGAACTPDLLRCAVDLSGISDLISFLNSMPNFWNTSKNYWYLKVGHPEIDAEFLKSRSPLYKVDNIKIPVLIGQGANDPRVKQAESDQMIAAMKNKGLPCEYVLFPDEGHGLAQPKNRLKFNAIAEKFLAQHLGGRYEA
jgi:dipeptidyl aminopeptidase/acylaminoacyl peptidase